jgi:hypothetical protein
LGLFIRRCEGDGMKMLVCVCFLCERLRERAFDVTSESQLTRAERCHLFIRSDGRAVWRRGSVGQWCARVEPYPTAVSDWSSSCRATRPVFVPVLGRGCLRRCEKITWYQPPPLRRRQTPVVLSERSFCLFNFCDFFFFTFFKLQLTILYN